MGPIMGNLSSHAQNISKYENSQKKTKNSKNGIATSLGKKLLQKLSIDHVFTLN